MGGTLANIKLHLYDIQSALRKLEKLANAEKDLASLVEVYRIRKDVDSSLNLIEKEESEKV